MLTIDILKGNEALSGLTEEQMQAVVTLSENDEQVRTVEFNKKFGEIYSGIDGIVKELGGIDRNSNEKTTDYLRRVMGQKNSDFDALRTQLAEAEKKNAGDVVAQKDATIADMTKKYNDLQAKMKEERTGFETKLKDYRITADIEAALGGLTYKEGFTPEMIEMAKRNAVEVVKGMNPGYVANPTTGKEVLVFHDKDGVEMRDSQMSLRTAADLLKEEMSKLGILSDGKQVGGAGGQGGVGRGNALPFTGATSRAEAYTMIENYLIQQGNTRGSVEFSQKKQAMLIQHKEALNALP